MVDDDICLIHGDALDFLAAFDGRPDMIVTDPPYAFGGSGAEHALSATVAVVLRECARILADGSWMLIFCASSWRSTAYMAESVRGILEPVRVGTWTKPRARTKARTPGWAWASVNVLACRKGKGRGNPAEALDHILAEPIARGRRAELPPAVAEWAVAPFAVAGGLFLDPFAGGGALLRAAAAAGMRAVG
jgi:tRNA G10  N-methylase Trm11